eukprot:jgi/Mesvir1/23514/Mv18220-RA.1
MGDETRDDEVPLYDRGPMYTKGIGYVDVMEGQREESDEGGHFCVGRMRISRDGSWTMVGQANEGRRNSPRGQGSGSGRGASHPQSKSARRRNRKKNRGAVNCVPNYGRPQASKFKMSSDMNSPGTDSSQEESEDNISDQMVEDYLRNCQDSEDDMLDGSSDIAALAAKFLVTSPDAQCPIEGGVLIHDDNEGEGWDGGSDDHEDEDEDEDDDNSGDGSGSESSGYSYGDLAAGEVDLDNENSDSDALSASEGDEDDGTGDSEQGGQGDGKTRGQGGGLQGGGGQKKKKKRLEDSFTRLRFGPGGEAAEDDEEESEGDEIMHIGHKMLAGNLDLDAFLGYRKPSRKNRRNSDPFPVPGRAFGAPRGSAGDASRGHRQGGGQAAQGSPAWPVHANGSAKRPKNLRPGEKKQLKQEAMEAKRAQRMAARGFDLDAVNKSLRRFVASQEDMWGGQAPRGKPEMAQVTRVARLYRLQVSLQGSGKKRILIVRRTRTTCMPEGEMAASLTKFSSDKKHEHSWIHALTPPFVSCALPPRSRCGENVPRHQPGAPARSWSWRADGCRSTRRWRASPRGGAGGGGGGTPAGSEPGSSSKKFKRNQQGGGKGQPRGKGGAGGSSHGMQPPRLRYASQPLSFVSNGVYDPNKDDEAIWRVQQQTGAQVPSGAPGAGPGHEQAAASSSAGGEFAMVSIGLGAGGSAAVDVTLVAGSAGDPPPRHHHRHHHPRSVYDGGGGSSGRPEPVVAGGGFGEFEQHTLGFGSRMLAKMGFKGCGSGLGKHQHGRSDPIGVVMRPKSLGLGADS